MRVGEKGANSRGRQAFRWLKRNIHHFTNNVWKSRLYCVKYNATSEDKVATSS